MTGSIDLARLRRAPRGSVRRARTVATRVARRTRRDHPGVARLAVRGQERARAVRARVRPHAPERPLEQVVFALSQALPDATFVQVGAHDGTQLDPLREAILGSRWTGVMVEPVPYVFERLALRYDDHPRLALENVAIADIDGSLPFHLLRQADHDDEEVWRWYDALGSFRREVVMSHAHLVPDIADRIETIEVPCVTFDTLCERNGLDHVDVVQIDTEGYDLQVLKLIDVPRLRPCLVLYEHLHLSPSERQEAEDLMTGHGFHLVSDGMDTLAVDDRALAHPGVAAAFDAAVAGTVTPPRQIPQRVRDGLLRRGVLVERLSEPERRFLTDLVDHTVPLPPGTADALRPDHPRLASLQALYAEADPAVRTHSRWSSDRLDPWLDLTRFRGDNAYIWHYREGRRISELKYLVWAQDVRHRDHAGLLDRLDEDGAFGCWTYEFDGLPRLSRDLLDSVGELLFLDASLGVLAGGAPRVLDIGAGYGRLAHRYVAACKDVADYACTDAIATSTFVCEHYLDHRGLGPTARAVPLTSVPDLAPGSFDLACNIHSWSECPLDAIAWWLDQLARLEVPHLFVVPNEAEGFTSLEADGRRLDYLPVIEAAGYRLVRDEPVFADPAVRAALGVHDRHTLFERTSS